MPPIVTSCCGLFYLQPYQIVVHNLPFGWGHLPQPKAHFLVVSGLDLDILFILIVLFNVSIFFEKSVFLYCVCKINKNFPLTWI